ncbi:MAG TPA: CBS domain-containing protein [Actinomycetota bacterium]
MKVRDVMTTDVAAVGVDATFHDIVRILVDRNLSGVPVVDSLGLVVGVVTENDLLSKEAYPPRKDKRTLGKAMLEWIAGEDPIRVTKAHALHAKDLMTQPPITISPDDTIHAAARRMIEYDVKRLPVTTNGLLVGLMSRRDVLTVYARPDATLTAEVEAVLARSLYVPPDNVITTHVEGGVATLQGIVHYQSDVRIIDNIVAAVDGITAVDNHLAFRDPDPKVHRPATDPRNIMTR